MSIHFPWWWNSLPEESISDSKSALDSRLMTSGNLVAEVEYDLAQVLEVPDAVLVSSGTDALLAALIQLGVGPGKNVIVPALTWIATAQAAAALGAEVRLCDVDRDSYCMSLDSVQELVDKDTLAVIFVLFNGRIGGLAAVKRFCREAGVAVIEDRCKAMGTSLESPPDFEDEEYAAFSLGMISHISVGYGGVLACSSARLGSRIRKIRDHGVERSPESYPVLGLNLKLSDFVAAMIPGQVAQLDARLEAQVTAEQKYMELLSLSSATVTPVSLGSRQIGTYTEGLSVSPEARSRLVFEAQLRGVELQPYHQSLSQARYLGDFSTTNADDIAARIFALPSGNTIGVSEIEQICEVLNSIDIL